MDMLESCEDIRLAIENLNAAIEKIERAKSRPYSPKEVAEIKNMLSTLFTRAFPYFVKGTKSNPIHHHTQVLDNMVEILLGEKVPYPQFKRAVVTALLHDIGNAISHRPKYKTDQVIAALTKDPEEGMRVASKAIAFRLEHMDNGPGLAREVLEPFLNDGSFGGEDFHFLCRAIGVHDYPSIEQILKDAEDKVPPVVIGKTKKRVRLAVGDFLLPFDKSPFGKLIAWLREADRLFMVSEQGVKKDLLDANLEVTSANVLAKLESNAKKHAREFVLYKRVGRGGGFRNQTLYRTRTGYAMFRRFHRSIKAKWANA